MLQRSLVFADVPTRTASAPSHALSRADAFFLRDADGSLREASDDELVAAVKAVMDRRFAPRTYVGNPTEMRALFQAKLAEREHEVFAIVYLDTRNRVIAYDEPFRGTIDQAAVYPREVVKAALAHNAAAVCIAHNHPSGVPEPSRADESFTSGLRQALGLVDIRMLDHIIIAGTQTYSFAEHGLL